jgi:alpha-amylase/alpha-mannosidase (GH57 family)
LDRFICIHGHYYQPPRENPWTGEIEEQASAHPYHDWNERITAECYAPNGAARILGPDGHHDRITNNYARTSFNFGPTLLSWIETSAPETYAAILAGERESRARFGGHGSALAQVYNHMIMPLANARDQRTQVTWGMRDFEHRFGRAAEGMWLPETAVDIASLEALTEQGVRFTVLAPRQASRVRRASGGSWRDVSGGRIDPTRAYEQRLPSGRRIAIFFYDGPISQAVAFEDLLRDGNAFADRLMGAFNGSRSQPQLVHIATDGETYGHHHRHGEMALAFALERLERDGDAKLTNYGAFLERHPPTHIVEIVENSSWSCEHGVERWRSDCGCATREHPEWRQAWRAPMRHALDWLRDELAPRYEREASVLLHHPWAARDAYIDVMLDRSPESVARFFEAHAAREPSDGDRDRALALLEMQRYAMLMYASCAWFFDDLAGIETRQVLQYAARAIELARETVAFDAEPRLLDLLGDAWSNVSDAGNGADIYRSALGERAR